MDAKKYVNEKLRKMPADLVDAVGQILKKHAGQEKAIDRHDLQGEVIKGTGEEFEDRQIRRASQALRLQGWRICNTIDGAGYFLASTEQEYQGFREQYGSYAATIWRVLKAMDQQRPVEILPKGAEELQPELF